MNLGCRYLDKITTKSVISNIRYEMWLISYDVVIILGLSW